MSMILRIEVPIPFPAQWVNSYYIHDSVPTLIDTGINTDEGLDVIQSGIEAAGGSLDQVRRIVATHGHMDHTGLFGRIADETSAEVFIHPLDKTYTWANPSKELEERRGAFRAFFTEAGLPGALTEEMIDLMFFRINLMFSPLRRQTPLEHGQVIGFDDFELEVIHTPGHSEGSVCLFNSADGTLFSGDVLLEEITCNIVADAAGGRQREKYMALASYQATLDLLDRLPVRRVMPGHGRPYSSHHKRIQRLRNHHQKRKEAILALVQNHDRPGHDREGLTPFMVAQRLFPTMTGMEYLYRTCAARVHLEALEAEGLVSLRRNGNRDCYWPSDTVLI